MLVCYCLIKIVLTSIFRKTVVSMHTRHAQHHSDDRTEARSSDRRCRGFGGQSREKTCTGQGCQVGPSVSHYTLVVWRLSRYTDGFFCRLTEKKKRCHLHMTRLPHLNRWLIHIVLLVVLSLFTAPKRGIFWQIVFSSRFCGG